MLNGDIKLDPHAATGAIRLRAKTLDEVATLISDEAVPVHKNASDTEWAAAAKVAKHRKRLRALVLVAVYLSHDRGVTGAELVKTLNVGESTARTRLTELGRMGLVMKTAQRRDNDRGNAEIVWRVTPNAVDILYDRAVNDETDDRADEG